MTKWTHLNWYTSIELSVKDITKILRNNLEQQQQQQQQHQNDQFFDKIFDQGWRKRLDQRR